MGGAEWRLGDNDYLSPFGRRHILGYDCCCPAPTQRRGPEVHTDAGKPQAHKDDDFDIDTSFKVSRKCPDVLNGSTLEQPKIDKSNQSPSAIAIAMEKMFVTKRFPSRLFTTVLGMIYIHRFLLTKPTST